MGRILKSRRLWAFIIAQVLTIVTMMVNHFVNDPFATQMATVLIGTVQGLAGILIVAYTVDDTASNVTAIKNGSHPYFIPNQPPAPTAPPDEAK